MNENNFKVSEEDNKKRLDKFLSEKLPQYSRSHLQKLIEDGFVLVGGVKKDKSYKLQQDNKVSVLLREPEEVSLEPDEKVKFEVVYEDKDLAVINKPAGLVVHPSDTHKKGTLVNGLLAKWPKIKSVGEDPLRPGIVHRLDKETSGLMVVAKNNETFFWLKEQFKERKVTKKYIALIFGKLTKEEGEINAPIGRVGMKQVTLKRGRGQKKVTKTREAVTKYKVLEEFGDCSLVEALPKTGRMHQIRVHFAHIGHPVVGDKKYAPGKLLEKIPSKRHFLHAKELVFTALNGKKLEFKADIPEDLDIIIRGLK